jgi:signal transduction histidine kinase
MSDAAETPPLLDRPEAIRPRGRSRAAVPQAAPAPRAGLFRKYVLMIVGLVAFVLLVHTAIDFWFSYGEISAASIRIQQEKAHSAARRIEGFVDEIVHQIGWTTNPQWAMGSVDQRRLDYVRLLRQVPPITELTQLDGAGREQLEVSRLAMDVVGSRKDDSHEPSYLETRTSQVWYGAVYFRRQSEPYMTIAVASGGRDGGVTVAEVNLKLIWDVISALGTGEGGYAYVVDQTGRLIAHPDISLVLRDTDLSQLPQVKAARDAAPGAPAQVTTARSLDDKRVLSAHAEIARLGWLVFVELPLSEALAPLYAAAWRTAGLLGLGLGLATLAALLLARRMVVPIRAIAAGAGRIGQGELHRRIEVKTGDEIEALADEFNRMAGELQKSYAELESRVVARTAELKEALDQQTATAEVLGVINSSPGDLAPVFDAMLEKALRLCQADFGILLVRDGDDFRTAAVHGVPPALAEFLSHTPRKPGKHTAVGRMLAGEDFVQFEDMAVEEAYQAGDARQRAFVELGGTRSYVAVALRKDGVLLGSIGAYRREVRSFTNKQIALLQNFAAQAVIAMENARLLAELRERTEDLQESLEYQTATSDVLKVISQSGPDLGSVLDTLVDTAARICRAQSGFIFQLQDGLCRMVASFGIPAEYKQFQASNPILPGRGSLAGRTVLESGVVHIDDAASDPEYTRAEAIRLGRQRTMLGVPLLREGSLIGVITLARSHVKRFSKKEIELVRTFADQAVIAIENARLLGELRARTAELGRSVEELKLLSEVGQAVSSTLDLGAVLSKILTASLGITQANAGAVFRYSRAERAFRLVEAIGWDQALTRSVRDLSVAETESAMGEAASCRMPIQLPDLEQRASYPLRDITLAAGFRSALAVPLVGAERILGAIILMRREAGEFPPETVRLMQTLASQSVLAIQNARLFREIADKSEQLALASQHKSQFLANMSHELRTPLNAILGYAELLVDGIYGELAPKVAGVLDRVQNNGRHLLALINDVLDLSKIEAGQLTLSLEDYALPEVVRSVAAATESLAHAKGLQFTTRVAPDLPTGYGDVRRLAQVLLNLVGNAVKFTDEGGVVVAAEAQNGQFVLTVRDTGPGIAPENHDRIFGEFQQIDNSNTRKQGGTGLGLAISKRMVEMQGGTITVDSELGRGATFRVALPIRVEPAAEDLAEAL